jgi:peroxiredoxin (alkyl hydroperoxide reductase subunit C)
LQIEDEHASFESTSGPKLDEPAPAFTTRTTHGVRSLDDYQGKWLMLFSHPSDFTPVCTSEFIALENKHAEFKARNCELLALSVDSVFSHRAWMQSINDNFDVKIRFPIIEDVSMAVAHAYGMIHDGSTSTSTIRSVFFINPQGILKAMIHYPLTVGRSVNELYRVLAALQESAGNESIVLPEGWVPGSNALLNPDINESANEGMDPLWYFKEVELSLSTRSPK